MLLLTDLSLPDGHGLELIYRLKTLQPGCEALVISVPGDENTVLACVEAGAVDYIHKNTLSQDIGDIIADVKRGVSSISPMIARKLLERLRQQQSEAPGASGAVQAVRLSTRENHGPDRRHAASPGLRLRLSVPLAAPSAAL